MNKTKNILQESTTISNNNNDAILILKNCVKNLRESYLDFLTAGLFILSNDATGRKGLYATIKSMYPTSNEWESVKHSWIRKLNQLEAIFNKQKEAIEAMDLQKIKTYLQKNNINSAYANQLIEAKKEEEKKKKELANQVKTPAPILNNDGESSLGDEINVVKIFNMIQSLDSQGKEGLRRYAESKGYELTFKKMQQKIDLSKVVHY